jgi:hypothetical protein
MPHVAARMASRDEDAGRYQRHRPEQTLASPPKTPFRQSSRDSGAVDRDAQFTRCAEGISSQPEVEKCEFRMCGGGVMKDRSG